MWIDYDCGECKVRHLSEHIIYFYTHCRQLRTGSGLVRIVVHIYIYICTYNKHTLLYNIICVCVCVYTRDIIILIFSCFTPFCVCGCKKVYILVLARRCVIDNIFFPSFSATENIDVRERELEREIPKPSGKKNIYYPWMRGRLREKKDV